MLMDQHQHQHQPYKHHCRICKKGFGCGRALGGHMRAHGINDDVPDDDPTASGDWDGPPKRMYALRTNPNRLKSCRICENCGKEFLSWKSFLEHGKCSSDDDIGDLDSPPSSDGGFALALDDDTAAGCAGWSKGKRSRRTKAATAPPSSEEEDLANCLVMLSAARVDPLIIVETEESCASASKEEDRIHVLDRTVVATDKAKAPIIPGVPRGLFECKACKKVFSSHQALGGHRASHKKVKGCFAARLDDIDAPPPEEEILHHQVAAEMSVAMSMAIVPFDNSPLAIGPLKKKSKVHECSICHRVFASGQALGGHKRCHWITSNSPDHAAMNKLPDHAALTLRPIFEPSDAALDLNYPAPADVALRLEVPGAMYMQSWIDQTNPNKRNKTASGSLVKNNSLNPSNTETSVDDEADSRVKLAKLSDLKDINMGGEASHWLQVGIGSSTNEGGGDP